MYTGRIVLSAPARPPCEPRALAPFEALPDELRDGPEGASSTTSRARRRRMPGEVSPRIRGNCAFRSPTCSTQAARPAQRRRGREGARACRPARGRHRRVGSIPATCSTGRWASPVPCCHRSLAARARILRPRSTGWRRIRRARPPEPRPSPPPSRRADLPRRVTRRSVWLRSCLRARWRGGGAPASFPRDAVGEHREPAFPEADRWHRG